MGIFGAVSPAESFYEADDFGPFFEAGVEQGIIGEMGKKWIRSDEQMCAGNQDSVRASREFGEECTESFAVAVGKDGESWEGVALAPIKRRGNPPNSAASLAEFFLLSFREFPQAIRWVGNNGVDGVRLSGIHPIEAITAMESIARHLTGRKGIKECLIFSALASAEANWQCKSEIAS